MKAFIGLVPLALLMANCQAMHVAKPSERDGHAGTLDLYDLKQLAKMLPYFRKSGTILPEFSDVSEYGKVVTPQELQDHLLKKQNEIRSKIYECTWKNDAGVFDEEGVKCLLDAYPEEFSREELENKDAATITEPFDKLVQDVSGHIVKRMTEALTGGNQDKSQLELEKEEYETFKKTFFKMTFDDADIYPEGRVFLHELIVSRFAKQGNVEALQMVQDAQIRDVQKADLEPTLKENGYSSFYDEEKQHYYALVKYDYGVELGLTEEEFTTEDENYHAAGTSDTSGK